MYNYDEVLCYSMHTKQSTSSRNTRLISSPFIANISFTREMKIIIPTLRSTFCVRNIFSAEF